MSGAVVEGTRASGLRRLVSFADRAGAVYTKSRNFDFGPGRRENVSMLSPFLRHRLVLEQEVLEAVLRRHSLAAANSFVEEVFWRTYYKGWLEHHSDVWVDYRQSLSSCIRALDDDADLLERYNTAVGGNTGIDCFDAWADELLTQGYLHNHARMWFASIWVFTLGLPWQLGADLFYRNLIDGDPASNTLSWRWVCGLHTRGKIYLARVSNIANYTDNRFNPHGQLATTASPPSETRFYPIQPLPEPNTLRSNERFGLLITEEDGCPSSLLGDQVPVAVLGALATRMRSPLPVGEPAYEFARSAVADAVERAASAFDADSELSTSDDWGALLLDWATDNRLRTIVTAYAPVGPVAEMLAKARGQLECHGIELLQLRRPYDSLTWPHAKRGYFKLRKQIPTLVERLQLVSDRNGTDSVAV